MCSVEMRAILRIENALLSILNSFTIARTNQNFIETFLFSFAKIENANLSNFPELSRRELKYLMNFCNIFDKVFHENRLIIPYPIQNGMLEDSNICWLLAFDGNNRHTLCIVYHMTKPSGWLGVCVGGCGCVSISLGKLFDATIFQPTTSTDLRRQWSNKIFQTASTVWFFFFFFSVSSYIINMI